jgi:hypothetical protein
MGLMVLMGLIMGIMGLLGRSHQECGLRGIGKRRWDAQLCDFFAIRQLAMASVGFHGMVGCDQREHHSEHGAWR